MTAPLPRVVLPVAVTGMALLVICGFSAYTLDEIEQAVIVRFGEPRRAVTNPGLHFRMPFIDEVRRFERCTMAWDGAPEQIPTRGRQFISGRPRPCIKHRIG